MVINMKRFISVLLAVLFSAGTLVSCAVNEHSSASVSSSGAEKYLVSRLGNSDGCTLLCGDDALAYSADLASLRDDGYVIRRHGGETVILAKTDDGLDRAVRYYVNRFLPEGETNYSYGEGYRVGALTVAGRDISEYVIRIAPDADYCHKYAAEELCKYIEKACGVRLETVTEDAPHMIVLDRVTEDDPRFEALGYEGFTIEVDANGNLFIHGGEDRGCLYGVYKLLEGYVGWRFYGDDRNMDATMHAVEYLYEADSVDIPAGLCDTQVPSFALRQISRGFGNDTRFCENNSFVGSKEFNGYHIIRAASHGIMYPYAEYYGEEASGQPCFTDEDFIESAKDYYRRQLDAKIDAGGVIGRDITYIDVAQCDSMSFCMCKKCTALYKKDGVYTGAVLDFTNKMADFAAEEYSPELYVLMLVYWGTTTPPKVTMPRPNVSGAYCFYNDVNKYVCYAHPISGEECRLCQPNNTKIGNDAYADELRRWCEICTRMIVWYYPGNWYNDALAVPDARTMYDDMRFLYECGVYGVYNCPSGCFTGYSATGTRPEDLFMSYALSHLAWDCTMSREEYDAMVYEFLEFTCGEDAAPYIDTFYDMRESWAREDCWSTHAWSRPDEILAFDRIVRDAEDAIYLFTRAEELACSADAEDLIRKMSMTTYYSVLVASHTPWFLNGTDAERARYEEIYDKMNALIEEYGFNMIGYDFDTAITALPEISTNPGSVMSVIYNYVPEWWNLINGNPRTFTY